ILRARNPILADRHDRKDENSALSGDRSRHLPSAHSFYIVLYRMVHHFGGSYDSARVSHHVHARPTPVASRSMYAEHTGAPTLSWGWYYGFWHYYNPVPDHLSARDEAFRGTSVRGSAELYR